MTAREILDHIEAENVKLVLLGNDKIDVSGDKAKVGKLLPFIRDHKTEIVNYLRGDDHEWISLEPSYRPAKKATNKRPSLVAMAWLQDHRQRLKAAGWAMAELYRRNKSPGIAWVSFWEKSFLRVYLQPGGIIEVEFLDGGKDRILTVRPESFWRKK